LMKWARSIFGPLSPHMSAFSQMNLQSMGWIFKNNLQYIHYGKYACMCLA
jgi:hypothetical protein